VRAGRTVHALLSLAIAISFAACFSTWALGEEAQKAPDYSARVLGSDAEATLAGLRGKVVLLNTWATWCPPCRAELPDFEAFYQSYRNRGLEVVGVNVDEGEVDGKVQRFVENTGLTFTIWRDPADNFAKRFRVLGVPATLLVDRDGTIVRRWSGQMDPRSPDNLEVIDLALEKSANTPDAADLKAAIERGRRLAEQRGCTNCHSTDGSKGVGPTWKGLFGEEVALDDGRQFTRDDAYLRRAIIDPDAEIVAGFERGIMSGAMPGKKLTDSEVEALVRYIKSL